MRMARILMVWVAAAVLFSTIPGCVVEGGRGFGFDHHGGFGRCCR